MTLPWPPDWRKKEDYPDPETTAPRMWAWEYLRRNRKYQELCDEIGLKWFKNFRYQLLEATNITEDELIAIINPIKIVKYKLRTDIETRIYKHAVSIYNNLLPIKNNIKDKFRLYVPDHYSINYPVTIFMTDINCIRRAKGRRLIKYPKKLIYNHPKANETRQTIYLHLIVSALNNCLEICGDIKFKRDPLGSVHIKNLRVHDADKDKIKVISISDEEISRIIYGSSNKLSSIIKSQQAAAEYIDKKYIALAVPLYKE